MSFSKNTYQKDRKIIRDSGLDIKVINIENVDGHDGSGNQFLIYFGFENTNEAILFTMAEDAWSYDLERNSVVYSIDKLNDLTPSNLKRRFKSLNTNDKSLWNNSLFNKMNQIIADKKLKTYLCDFTGFAGIENICYIMNK